MGNHKSKSKIKKTKTYQEINHTEIPINDNKVIEYIPPPIINHNPIIQSK